MSVYRVKVKYQDSSLREFVNDYRCRETLYSDFSNYYNNNNKILILTIQALQLDYFNQQALDNFINFLSNTILKSYIVVQTPNLENDYYNRYNRNSIDILFEKEQNIPHPAIISLVALLLRFYIRDFEEHDDLKHIIQRVLHKCVYRIRHDPIGRIATAFYMWYITNILDETPTLTDDYITENSNGPNSYSKFLLEGYNNGYAYSPSVDTKYYTQFIDIYSKTLKYMLPKIPNWGQSGIIYSVLKRKLSNISEGSLFDLDWS